MPIYIHPIVTLNHSLISMYEPLCYVWILTIVCPWTHHTSHHINQSINQSQTNPSPPPDYLYIWTCVLLLTQPLHFLKHPTPHTASINHLINQLLDTVCNCLIYVISCPRDKPFPLGADTGYTSENEAMTILSRAKMNAFDMGSHGQFFWNFRTEFEPRWSYLEAVRLNWLPKVTRARASLIP